MYTEHLHDVFVYQKYSTRIGNADISLGLRIGASHLLAGCENSNFLLILSVPTVV